MKYFFLFLFFASISQLTIGQNNVYIDSFVKSFERNFIAGNTEKEDSCFFISTLLKVRINNCKVSSLSLSDNAEKWMVEELNTINKKLNTKPLEEYAKKNEIKEINIFFPFVIRKEGRVNNICSNYLPSSNLLFRFNNKNIDGNCLFADRIELIYY